jgi:hypothetical protein
MKTVPLVRLSRVRSADFVQEPDVVGGSSLHAGERGMGAYVQDALVAGPVLEFDTNPLGYGVKLLHHAAATRCQYFWSVSTRLGRG